MAKAKCKICGTTLDTKGAYKVTDKNGKNKYFCNQSEFEVEEARKKRVAEDKDKVYSLICDMFGYEIQNTQFFAEWTLWNKLKSNEIIYKYLRENEDYLQQICDKPFNSEYQRIRYFSAVLKNNLRDYVPKIAEIEKPKVISKEEPRVVSSAFELFEPTLKKTPQTEEQILYDVEDDLL